MYDSGLFLQEYGMSSGVKYDVPLNQQRVNAVNGNGSIKRVVHAAVFDVRLADITHEVKVNGILSQLEPLARLSHFYVWKLAEQRVVSWSGFSAQNNLRTKLLGFGVFIVPLDDDVAREKPDLTVWDKKGTFGMKKGKIFWF